MMNQNKLFHTFNLKIEDLLNVGKPYWQRPFKYTHKQTKHLIYDYALHPENVTIQPLTIEIGFPLKNKNFPYEDDKARNSFHITDRDEVINKLRQGYGYIIDGQQRLSALFAYFHAFHQSLQHNTTFMKALKQFNHILNINNKHMYTFSQMCTLLIHNTQFQRTIGVLSTFHKKSVLSQKLLTQIKHIYQHARNHYEYHNKKGIHIDTKIRVTIAKNPESDWGQIFSDINSRGKKLSKFEVLEGNWAKYKFRLPNNDISKELHSQAILYLQSKKKRSKIPTNTRGFIANKNYIHMAILAHALGIILQSNCKSLIPDKSSREKLGLWLLVEIASLKSKNTKFFMHHDIQHLYGKYGKYIQNAWTTSTGYLDTKPIHDLIFIARKLNNVFKLLLLRHTTNKYISDCISRNQVFTFFCSLLQAMYSQKFNTKLLNKELYNIRIAFVGNCLYDLWGGQRDKQRTELYRMGTDDYSNSPTTPVISRQNMIQQAISYINKISMEVNSFKLNKTKKQLDKYIHDKESSRLKDILDLHANMCYFNQGIPMFNTNYQIEHGLITVGHGLQSELSSGNTHNQIPFNALGNMFLLPSHTNNTKKSQTLYEYAKQTHKLNNPIYAQYFKTTRYQVSKHINLVTQHFVISNALKKHDYKEVRKVINKRTISIIKDIINKVYDDKLILAN